MQPLPRLGNKIHTKFGEVFEEVTKSLSLPQVVVFSLRFLFLLVGTLHT